MLATLMISYDRIRLATLSFYSETNLNKIHKILALLIAALNKVTEEENLDCCMV